MESLIYQKVNGGLVTLRLCIFGYEENNDIDELAML